MGGISAASRVRNIAGSAVGSPAFSATFWAASATGWPVSRTLRTSHGETTARKPAAIRTVAAVLAPPEKRHAA